MHVARADALVEQVVGKVFRHLFRQCGNKHALVTSSAFLCLVDDVVNLTGTRSHDDFRIEQAGGSNNLLDLLLAYLFLVVTRCSRHVDELRHALFKLVEAQRTVIQAAWQAEPVLCQRDLTRAVAFVHAANLRHGHVAFVDNAQKVVGEIVDKRVGGLAWLASVQMARVVLDAAAKAHRLQHFQIVVDAHLKPLCLQQLPLGLELLQALAELFADGLKRMIHLGTRRHVVRSGPDGQRLVGSHHFAGYVVDLGDLLNLVAPKLHTNGIVGVGREHIERVTTHAKRAALELVIVAVVLNVDKVVNDIVAVSLFLLVQKHRQPRIVHRAADAVDAAHRRHDHAVAPREQRRGGGVAQFLDLLVDGRVLLDERI